MSDIIVSAESGGVVTSVGLEDGGADTEIGAGSIQVVTLSGGGLGGVSNLADILDVDTSNLDGSTNKYVMVYDATTQKYIFVNPDAILDASVGVTTSDPAPVGMSTETINYLDQTLDNRIDFDGGYW